MNLLTAELSLVVILSSGYSPVGHVSDPAEDEAATVAAPETTPACDEPNFLEVPAGEFDPASVPMEDGIVWYGTWEDAMAEKERTGKPVALHFGSPRRPKDYVCVPGAW